MLVHCVAIRATRPDAYQEPPAEAAPSENIFFPVSLSMYLTFSAGASDAYLLCIFAVDGIGLKQSSVPFRALY